MLHIAKDYNTIDNCKMPLIANLLNVVGIIFLSHAYVRQWKLFGTNILY
jgi:hypothetical protein